MSPFSRKKLAGTRTALGFMARNPIIQLRVQINHVKLDEMEIKWKKEDEVKKDVGNGDLNFYLYEE